VRKDKEDQKVIGLKVRGQMSELGVTNISRVQLFALCSMPYALCPLLFELCRN